MKKESNLPPKSIDNKNDSEEPQQHELIHYNDTQTPYISPQKLPKHEKEERQSPIDHIIAFHERGFLLNRGKWRRDNWKHFLLGGGEWKGELERRGGRGWKRKMEKRRMEKKKKMKNEKRSFLFCFVLFF